MYIYTYYIFIFFERESERTQKRQKEGEAINEVIAEKENERGGGIFSSNKRGERGQ